MKRRNFLKLTSATSIATLITPTGIIQSMMPKTFSSLEDSFINPPNSAKPGNMWFWMNGQVTKEGITLDLEAMERVGIGSIFNFDAGTGIPKGSLKYLSPEWFAAKAHALAECDRLGLEFCMHNCPGWSSSGGPWILPQMSMKTLTWSEKTVKVLKDASLKIELEKPTTKLDLYKEVVVLAFPALPENTKPFADWTQRTNKEFNRGLKDIEDIEGQSIDKNLVLNVSKNMNSAGVLELDPNDLPAGHVESWTFLRIGYTSLATENRSAPDSGVGLECDKFDPKAVEFHFDKMMTALLPYITPLAKKGKMGLEIDSWEIGMQNWTDGFEHEFEKRNGYSLMSFLPAMTGKIVENADTTERFLWDLRRTQADLLADNYYGKFAELCKKQGIKTFYEPYDRGPMEELQIGSRGDVVMGEYWNGLSTIFQNNLTMRRTCKLASSIAHINGQKIVGVEGLTGEPESAQWQEYVFAMKPICDKIFTMGINRIMIHRNAHQPHPTAVPGMTMGAWGIQFDRTNSMWEVNKPWLKYISRCQSLLQQGLFVADLAYFTSEDAGGYTKVEAKDLTPSPIEGYDYDVINAEVLMRKAKIVDNRLVLPDGMSYKVLVLQEYKTMSLELLQLIKQFVNQGLIVIGKKPETTPSLKNNNPTTTTEFETISDELWGIERDVVDRKVGNGRVFYGQSLVDILKAIDLKPDFVSTSKSEVAPIKYIHRNINGDDFYFVCNQRRSYEDLVCSFRVKGKKPELWDANSGKIVDAPVYEEMNGVTNVAFNLNPYGSVFIVFRKAINKAGIKSVDCGRDVACNVSTKAHTFNLLPPSKDLVNNFSIEFWAKPEYKIMLSTKAFYEGVKDPWTDFFAIYPVSGEKYFGKGHAISGVTVGRNGVAIWENTNGTPVFKMSAKTPISGWSHIVVVYSEGIPSIYVNGNFIAKLETQNIASLQVHAPILKDYLKEGASYYNGDMTEPVIYNDVLSESKIKELSRKDALHASQALGGSPYSNNDKSSSKQNSVRINQQYGLIFFENGEFTLADTRGKITKISVSEIQKPSELVGEWSVYFPAKMGAPAKITLPNLMSLKNHSDNGVKYFSGTATYRKEFEVKSEELKVKSDKSNPLFSKKHFIDLGEVEVIAEVILNGKNLGIFWTRPYLVEVTNALKEGKNILEMRVTNQWVNRLIGDAQLPDLYKYATKGEGTPFAPLSVGAIEELPDWYLKGEPKPDDGRVTFTTWKHHTKDSPLLESGLIGPVVLKQVMSYE